jgi:hypothetical protein
MNTRIPLRNRPGASSAVVQRDVFALCLTSFRVFIMLDHHCSNVGFGDTFFGRN